MIYTRYMSTRAQIGVYKTEEQKPADGDVFIYRHNGGYPEGILEEIVKTCEYMAKARGFDHNYLQARLTATMCATRPGCQSVGIGTLLGQDIDYFYHVSPAKVQVFAVNHEDLELVQTVEIQKENGMNEQEFQAWLTTIGC